MPTLDRLVDVRLGEFAHGMTRLAMRRSMASFVASTLFASLLFALVLFVYAVDVSLGRTEGRELASLGYFGFMLAWGVVLLPWTRTRLMALFLRLTRSGALAPYRIVSFEPGSMHMRSEFGESSLAFGRFDLRFETDSVFVLGRPDQPLGSVIPKRVFADDAECAAFRAAFFAVSPATNEALHAMSEPIARDAIRYVLTPAEHMRAVRHLLRSTVAGRILVFVLLVGIGVFAFYLARIATTSPETATFVVVFIGAALLLGVRRGAAQLRARLTETTFAFDEHGVRFRSSGGSLESAWSDVRGLVEDELVLVLRLQRDVGIVVPKRVLDGATTAELRGRATASA